MKRLTVLLTLAVFLVAASADAQVAPAGKGKPTPGPKPQTIFLDNFNGGNLSQWYVVEGDWRIEQKVLVQTNGGDWNLILLPEFDLGSQSTEVMMTANDWGGYGSIYFWRQDAATYLGVRIYPSRGGLWVGHIVDGVGEIVVMGGTFEKNTWYKLRVDANSETGAVDIFVDDVYFGTYMDPAAPSTRSGLTGLHSGNSGGAFDNFRIRPLAK